MGKQTQVYQTITIIEWRNKHRCTQQSQYSNGETNKGVPNNHNNRMGKHFKAGVPNNHNNRMGKQTQVYRTITIIEWGNKPRCTKQSQ